MNDRNLGPAALGDPDPDMELDADGDIDAAEDDGGAFHDPVLRRALAHASDHSVVPMEETRESIRAFAHEAVAPSLPAAPRSAQRSALQRVLGLRGGVGVGAHIPWNAVLATVVVGAVMVWQERRLASDSEQEKSVPTAATAEVPAMPGEPSASEAPPTPATTAAPAPLPLSSSSAAAPEPAPSAPPAAVPPPPTISLPSLATLPVESPAEAAARLQLEQKLQRLEAAEARARLAQQSDSGGLPASLFPSTFPKTAIPVEVPRAGRTAATAAGGAAPAPAAGTGTGRVDESPPPNFVALSQWTRLTITPAGGGESWRVVRSEARELGALVGSAALAGVGPQPLSGRVDWRIVLERNGEPLATLETAGSQVRWKEGGMPAAVGVPAGNALNALRQVLKESQAQAGRPAAPAAPAAPASMLPAAPAASPIPARPDAMPEVAPPGTVTSPAFEMPR